MAPRNNQPSSSSDLTRIDRRTQIVDEAAILFARKGFASTSLRDVSERCDMTKAALYYYFPDKESLVKAVYVTRITQLNKSMRQALARVEDEPIARIRAFIAHCASRIDGNREAWIVSSQMFGAIEATPGAESIIALRDEFETMLREEVVRAIDQGHFRPNDPRLTTRLLLSWVNYMPRWHKQGTGLSAEEISQTFLDMTLYGLLSPKH